MVWYSRVFGNAAPDPCGHPLPSRYAGSETGRSWRVPCLLQVLLNQRECLEGRALASEVQDQLPRLADVLGGAVHDFLQHRLEAAALGRVAHWAGLAQQPRLSNQPQAIVGQHGQVQDEVVAVELAGRQALQVEVGLDLAVELLVRAVFPVKLDDLLGLRIQARPPALQLVFWKQQGLPLLVGGALNQAHDEAEVPALPFPKTA